MQLRTSRAGVTLVETMVALVLTTLTLALIYQVMVAQQRTVTLQAERSLMETNLRTGVALLAAELSDASTLPADTDLQVVAGDSVTYRAMRGAGVACLATASTVDVLASSFQAYRRPQPGRDSLLLYVGPDSLAGRLAEWVAAPVNGVASSSCGGALAMRLSTVIDTASLIGTGPGSLFPIRVFEVMQVRLYRSTGAMWLGARSVSAGEVIQPVLGPLETGGLSFRFLDSLNLPTTRPGTVRSGGVVLRAISSRLRDTVQVLLPLRNALR